MAGEQGKAIAAAGRTKDIVRRHGFVFKKSLGQNFLIDSNILDKIIAAAGLHAAGGALEIGPGIGALTERLAQEAGVVAALEIDRTLLPILADVLSPYDNVHIYHADVLKTDLSALWKAHFADVSDVSVVANLPYYVTTPIVMKLLETRLSINRIVIMVQKEVAQRMTATPGSKTYGSLSIAVQYYSEPEWVTAVPASSFLPPPNVESAVIRLTKRSKPAVSVPDEARYFRVIHASFAQRRKTLVNNLLQLTDKARKAELAELLTGCGIHPQRRAETLSLAEFALVDQAMAAAGMI